MESAIPGSTPYEWRVLPRNEGQRSPLNVGYWVLSGFVLLVNPLVLSDHQRACSLKMSAMRKQRRPRNRAAPVSVIRHGRKKRTTNPMAGSVVGDRPRPE